MSALVKREEDLVLKPVKIFLESLRGLGEAGDWGASWKEAVGVVASVPWRFAILGEVGLKGLVAALGISLPVLGRMANDREEDFGIFAQASP